MFLSNRPQAASLQHHRVHHEARTIILDTSRAGVHYLANQTPRPRLCHACRDTFVTG